MAWGHTRCNSSNLLHFSARLMIVWRFAGCRGHSQGQNRYPRGADWSHRGQPVRHHGNRLPCPTSVCVDLSRGSLAGAATGSHWRHLDRLSQHNGACLVCYCGMFWWCSLKLAEFVRVGFAVGCVLIGHAAGPADDPVPHHRLYCGPRRDQAEGDNPCCSLLCSGMWLVLTHLLVVVLDGSFLKSCCVSRALFSATRRRRTLHR
jgi:hypothetical protein